MSKWYHASDCAFRFENARKKDMYNSRGENERKGGMLLLLLSEKGNPRGALMSLPCLVLPASIWVLLAVPP